MKTDYKNINSFEVAVVGMIAIGFVIVGIFLFATLTPRQQTRVTSAFDLLDIHEQTASTAASTIEGVKFVIDVPNEFYNQFYIAFTEVAALPSETFEVPQQIATDLVRNFSIALNNLTDQVATGYAAQNQLQDQKSQLTELAYDGKVMGAMIEISDKLSSMTVRSEEHTSELQSPDHLVCRLLLEKNNKDND